MIERFESYKVNLSAYLLFLDIRLLTFAKRANEGISQNVEVLLNVIFNDGCNKYHLLSLPYLSILLMYVLGFIVHLIIMFSLLSLSPSLVFSLSPFSLQSFSEQLFKPHHSTQITAPVADPRTPAAA